MTINLQNYSVCTVDSFAKCQYISTVLKNHMFNLITNVSLCGSVDLNRNIYEAEQTNELVECKSCARAYDKIKAQAAAQNAQFATVETETETETDISCATDTEHIISELSQAAQNLRYVQATCENDEQYSNILTVAECNELDEMFERLQEIITIISA